MRISHAWLIPTLASSLALGACDARDTTVAELQTDKPVVAQSPFMTDELGKLELGSVVSTLRGPDAMDYAAPAASLIDQLVLDRLNAVGTEQLEAFWVRENGYGKVGIRFEQSINGLPVRGAQLYMSVDKASGVVERLNGDFVADRGLAIEPALGAQHAIESALIAADIRPERRSGDAELVYVLDEHKNAVLAWETEVEYTDAQGNPQRDIIFADAITGEMTTRHPQHKYARQLETRDCGERTRCNTVVSTSSNEINTGDLAVDSAHNYAIATYNYYSNNHGRDSIDDNGMTLISRVHYNRNYNNAFWDGSQMTYGDGDGSTFIPLSQDADVVAHELTHGVTERSSNLVYQNESGALNEALSDIFGALVDRQEGANVTDTWLLGEDIYTPGTPGDGLRVMNDPAAAGDYDYYPTRYTGTSDNGGVHWNSGIANLAFVLLVEGGTHPRGATSVNVPALNADFDTSLQMAGDIFYAANTSCLTSNSNFEAARYCTADAANAIYGQTAFDAVHAAWDAVGVPGDSSGGGGNGGGGSGCTGTITVSFDEVRAVVGANELVQYTITVPADACNLVVNTRGSHGDVDLYVKLGGQASPSSYDYGSYSPDSNEDVNVASPAPGDWSIVVHGYRRSNDVAVHGEYQNP